MSKKKLYQRLEASGLFFWRLVATPSLSASMLPMRSGPPVLVSLSKKLWPLLRPLSAAQVTKTTQRDANVAEFIVH